MSECRPPALDEEAKRERERGREREREREEDGEEEKRNLVATKGWITNDDRAR